MNRIVRWPQERNGIRPAWPAPSWGNPRRRRPAGGLSSAASLRRRLALLPALALILGLSACAGAGPPLSLAAGEGPAQHWVGDTLIVQGSRAQVADLAVKFKFPMPAWPGEVLGFHAKLSPQHRILVFERGNWCVAFHEALHVIEGDWHGTTANATCDGKTERGR